MTEFLDTSKPFPYCPGCGHPHVLRYLDEALVKTGLTKEQITLVTDIGCVGLADAYFPTVHTVHSLHGRSVAVASGLYLGDRATPKAKPLKPIVLIGDGGVGIGLLHVVHAAQINANVTVLVHDNLIYGMTGGQHSMLTPPGMKTTTTPEGNVVPPLDLGAIIIGAGGGFFARTSAPGDDVAGFIAQAIEHPGFSCVEIYELCPTFATRKDGLTARDLKTMPERLGRPFGILKNDRSRAPFVSDNPDSKHVPSPTTNGGVTPNPAWKKLDKLAQIVIAGRAGEHIQSAATLTATAAAAAGLFATIRTDNPVTQGSGFSLAEITISPEPVAYTGLRNPDVVIVTAAEGQKELESRGVFKNAGSFQRLVGDTTLTLPEAPGIAKADYRTRFGAKNAALGAVIEEISRAAWWDRAAWQAAIDRLPTKQKEDAAELLKKANG